MQVVFGNAAVILLLLVTSMSSIVGAFRHFNSRSRLVGLQRHRSLLISRVFSMNVNGAKPDFSKEVNEKYFDYNRLEPKLYSWWESKGMFKPDTKGLDKTKGKKPFVIPMPPPNVTGYLHMGHAIFVALQDIMARFHRMRGRPTLWLPGT